MPEAPRTCFRCGRRAREDPGFHARCEECGSYLHACRNCLHFDWDGRLGACLSPAADAPLDATAQNFCEEFVFVGALPAPSEGKRPAPRRGAEAFRRLFGG